MNQDHLERLRQLCLDLPETTERLGHGEPTWFIRGWLGVRLDVPVDWSEIAAFVADAYRVIAPKRLLAELDARNLP